MDGRSELEEVRERSAMLHSRYKEARAAASETRDHAERTRQKHRAKVLWDMYKEARAEVRRLDPEAVKNKSKKKSETGTSGAALDILLRSGALWSDLEGYSWSQLEGYTWGGERANTGRAAQKLTRMVREGLARCTPRQQKVLMAYYTSEDCESELGEQLGVNKSTVSRTITRALQHVSRYVTAKLLIQRCVDQDGYFDYLTFINSSRILTDRQREMVFLLLSRDTSYEDMAQYLQRNRSTVWRTAERVENRLRGLGVELDIDLSAVKVRREDWENISEKELAQQLGLSPRFWFFIARWGEQAGDIPLLHYVILRRLEKEPDTAAVAAEMGCSREFVDKLRRKYRGAELPDVPVEDYRPVKPKRVRLPDNPYAAFGEGGAIIDCIDAATWRAIQARFGTA